MAGAKQYDRDELLDRAIELFRRKGYSDTSTAELVSEFGVNRKSMYAEFGSKQELFEAALDRYNQVHLSRVIAPIEAENASSEAIRKAFADYASASKGRFRGRGCLMCNTAVERAALDPATGKVIAAFLERLTQAFRNSLINAQRNKEIDANADIDELAAFFTMSLIGVAACVRAEASPEQVYAACRVVSNTLDAHAPSAPVQT